MRLPISSISVFTFPKNGGDKLLDNSGFFGVNLRQVFLLKECATCNIIGHITVDVIRKQYVTCNEHIK